VTGGERKERKGGTRTQGWAVCCLLHGGRRGTGKKKSNRGGGNLPTPFLLITHIGNWKEERKRKGTGVDGKKRKR